MDERYISSASPLKWLFESYQNHQHELQNSTHTFLISSVNEMIAGLSGIHDGGVKLAFLLQALGDTCSSSTFKANRSYEVSTGG
jgi:hypothetical protein